MSENEVFGIPAYHSLKHQEGDEDAEITPYHKSTEVFSRQMPPNASDPTSVDSLIAAQMAKLSVADREKVYMDVHGIPDFVEETPVLIQESLVKLHFEIELLPDKKAYNTAEQLDPKYTQDVNFRLAFLRCDKFDCYKAALRIVRHFEIKMYLFGVDKLVVNITQDDLDADAMEALYDATGRFLNAYDSGGRIINLLVHVPKVYKTDPFLRKGFYNTLIAFRDVEIQRRGYVTILLHSGDLVQGMSGDNSDLNWKLPKLNEGSPMYLSAVHLCYSQEKLESHFAVIKTAFSEQNQVRIRVHHGTVAECLERLRGHGIDPSIIPVDFKCQITDHLEAHQRLEEERRQERLKYPTRSAIGVPFCEDVLLGKGTPFQIHTGNKKLRKMVSDRQKEYEKAQKGRKKVIAREIVDAIMGNGGLFLKQVDHKWFAVDVDVAVTKVSANFRSWRRLLGHSSLQKS